MNTDVKRRLQKKNPTRIPSSTYRAMLRGALGKQRFTRAARVLMQQLTERRLHRALARARELMVHDAVRHGREPTGHELLFPQDFEVAVKQLDG